MKTIKRTVKQTVLKRRPTTEYTIYKTDRQITEKQVLAHKGETDPSKILQIDVTCTLPAEESKPVQVDDWVLVDVDVEVVETVAVEQKDLKTI